MTLRCEGLRKAFHGTEALAGVDLEFPGSGIVAIIGPNGAGKTTLLNVITGFVRPDSGRWSLGGEELMGMDPHMIARHGIARTFQDLRLVTLVPVLENVMLARPNQSGERLLPALLRYGVAQEEARNREAALNWLRFVGLDRLVDQPVGELSYGQQKLLCLACCLATEARVLLLDEPVSGIHPSLIEKVLGLLEELRERGRLVVFIEHDIAAVRRIADTVIVMDDGRIIANGKPSQILEMPEIMEAYVG